MKPTKLIIKNIGKLAGEQTVDINKPLILFYGEIKQGKTTILNCVRWVCGGAFPDDIISHGQKEASIELHFDGGLISRSWYRGKDSKTASRSVVFVRNGKPVPQPVTEIKRLLNPFLLDQDFLRNKTELERKQYFTELFAVDTTELDTELFNSQRDAQSLRAKISGYGEIDLTPVESVDVGEAQAKLKSIRSEFDTKRKEASRQSMEVTSRHSQIESSKMRSAAAQRETARLKSLLDDSQKYFEVEQKWLSENPELTPVVEPIEPDTAALEKKIQDAGAQNVRAENYKTAKARSDAKKADEKVLSAMEKRQREIKAEKQAKLKSIGDSCGIDGLEFDEAGNFIYQGTTAGMISDSQIMRLSSELSALYPDGFGLDLIDRAESLGKSIFEFVDRAKAEKKTIMATIVGERPAKVPPEIGVFVVEEGKVSL